MIEEAPKVEEGKEDEEKKDEEKPVEQTGLPLVLDIC